MGLTGGMDLSVLARPGPGLALSEPRPEAKPEPGQTRPAAGPKLSYSIASLLGTAADILTYQL